MRNRAKCKLCNNVIESFHHTDYVICECSEIALDGGEALKCYAKDWNNFIRIDDDNKEVPIKISDEIKPEPINVKPLYKEEALKALQNMIDSYESLPSHALSAPASNYDILATLLLVSAIFKSE